MELNELVNINENEYYSSFEDEIRIDHFNCDVFNEMDVYDDRSYLTLKLDRMEALYIKELYNKIKELIFSKSDEWLEEPLNREMLDDIFKFPLEMDIENNKYRLRTLVNMNYFNIKDKNDNNVKLEDINSSIKPEIVILGIRYIDNNFVLDIELRNIIVLNDELNEYIIDTTMAEDTRYIIKNESYDLACNEESEKIEKDIMNKLVEILELKNISYNITNLEEEIFESFSDSDTLDS
jgi:hypothetical protein